MLADNPLDMDGVVLVRLLTRPQKFTMSVLVKDLQSLLWLEDKKAARKMADAALARLKKAGHIWADTKFILTDEGEAAALTRLGLSGAPQRQKLDWRWAKKQLLVRYFRFTSGAAGDAGKSMHLAAWILAFKENLRFSGPPTPAAVLQALAWRALGFADKGPLRGNTAVGALLALARPDTEALVPSAEENKPNVGVIRRSSPKLRSDEGGSEITSSSTLDFHGELRAFAETVNALALSAKTGKWIGDKVYVAQVWRDFKSPPGTGKPSLDAFKQRLIAAARSGLLLLSRADLVGAYPSEALKESRIEVGGEVYHFVETQHLRRMARAGS